VTEPEALSTLRDVLASEFGVQPDKVTREATFRGTLGLDSLDVVELITTLERRFAVRATLDSYRELHTVEKLLGFLLARRAT
jgi:acyl carrier protein